MITGQQWGQHSRDGRWHRIVGTVGHGEPVPSTTICRGPATIPEVTPLPLRVPPPDGATGCDEFDC